MDGVVMANQGRCTRKEVWCKISLGATKRVAYGMYVCTWMGGGREETDP